MEFIASVHPKELQINIVSAKFLSGLHSIAEKASECSTFELMFEMHATLDLGMSNQMMSEGLSL